MTKFHLIAAAGLLLAFGARAAEQPAPAQANAPVAAATPAPVAASAPVPEGAHVVCAREQLVGSRLTQRVCRTVDPAMDDYNRRETQRAFHQGAPAGAQGINGLSGG